MNRRTLFKWVVQGTSLIIGTIIVVPALITGIGPGLRRYPRGQTWRAVGRLEEFEVGAVTEATVDPSLEGWPPAVRPQGVYVWRAADDQVIVFSRLCTDLGCPVNYDPGSECYFCPCHGGIFNKDGDRMAGPPDRPLDRYLSRVRAGVVEVDVSSVPPVV